MRPRWKRIDVLLLSLALSVTAIADDKPEPEKHDHDAGPAQLGAITTQRLLDIDWQPGPFPGSRIAVLAGDPKTGMHHTFLLLPKGARVAPHWHSAEEWVTVVEGTVVFGQGEKVDEKATRAFGPGAFLRIPARTPHYVYTKEQTILSQTRTGAGDFHWVNPEDDPARAKATPETGKK